YRLSKATNNRVMISRSMPEAQQDDVITQLASELSEAGKKVLLLDADLRQGTLFKHFDKTGEQGLADNLMNSDHSVVAVNQYLDLVSGSSRPANPSELLMCPAFKELLEWASSQYEVILINVPPVLKATDAAIVGDLCDTSLVVIQAEATSIKDIEAANRRLQQAGVMVNGAVFIKIPE
nr:CpsD/CapB family tyrosine-protein kinase [Endozoicomonas sp.]